MRNKYYYYILLAVAIYLLVGVFSIFLVSKWIGEHYFQQTGENAINMATLAANSISITSEELDELEKMKFNNLLENKNNKELSNLFTKTEFNQDVKYAYVLRKIDKSNIKYYVTNADKEFYEMPVGTALDWIWLIDVIVNKQERQDAEKDPEYYSDKNRYTHISGETEKLYLKQESGYFVNNDEWGSQISGMVPIYTNDGQFIGLLGVDVYSDGFYTYRNKMIFILFLLLLIPSSVLLTIFLYFHLNYRKDMKSIVFQDKLSGLYTRTYYENYVKQLKNKLRRAEDSITVIMVDIDDFKEYNDYYGHLKGDEVLKQVAMTFRNEIELVDGCPGRYGGEEFIALVPNLGLEQGNQLCERIRRKIEDLSIIHENRQKYKFVTISIGIYSSTKKDKPFEIEKLTEKADKALYIAKKEGKNCVRREVSEV